MVNWKVVKPKPRYEDSMEDMFSKADMKFNDLQKLMVDHYTGFLEVMKESFASYDKVAHSPVHESEKDILDREGDPSQSLNEHNTNNVKSDNVVEDARQSSKDFEEDLHNTNGDLSKAITLYVPLLPAAYSKGIIDSQSFMTNSVIAAIDTCNLQGNADCQSYISYSAIVAIFQDENVHSMKVASLERSICDIIQGLCIPAGIPWHLIDEDYGMNEASNGYVSDNQDPPRPKRTFIPSEDTEMIDVEM
ncbi:hypothetical protein FXO37_11577 [Capsicum annuum]|nr:hypothetical protein FXO37_11577 [Capsicum annuum]